MAGTEAHARLIVGLPEGTPNTMLKEIRADLVEAGVLAGIGTP